MVRISVAQQVIMPVWITPRFGVLSDKNREFLRTATGMMGEFISGLHRSWEGFYSVFLVDRTQASAQFCRITRQIGVLSDKP
jgi:hypothetical protein